ncbi:MAG: 1,4-beta-N-acetylmuramidase [Oscillospiraceae bacterium]|nr:1,4-beta-N-acetylmuramidase [Oscillospiraceae bacterium]
MTMKGIDVSGWQGKIDFAKVKASGVEFVIVKAGYSTSTVDTFESNYAAAKAAGLHVGAYWYSYADSVEDALAEAKACVKAVKGKQFDFPIYFDLEENFQFQKGKAFCDSLVNTFCPELEKNGLFTGLYMSRWFLENYISESVRKRFAIWVAEYSSVNRYKGTYGIWQYGVGRVSGIDGDCDMDIGYIDYPAIIKNAGLNGYDKSESPESPESPTKKSVEEIAREVIRGDWGNGEERKKRLTQAGYDYSAVQSAVEKML